MSFIGELGEATHQAGHVIDLSQGPIGTLTQMATGTNPNGDWHSALSGGWLGTRSTRASQYISSPPPLGGLNFKVSVQVPSHARIEL